MIEHSVVTNKENENVSYVEHHFAELIGLYNGSYDIFLKSIIHSQEELKRGNDLEFHKVYLTMGMKINSDVRTIIAAACMGWYGTAHAIFRDINDALLTISLIVREPNYASMIIRGELSNKAIRGYAKEFKIIGALTKRDWGRLSKIKHAEGEEVLKWYGKNNDSKIQFRLVPEINEIHVKFIFVYACDLLVRAATDYRDFHLSKYGSVFHDSGFLEEIILLNLKIVSLMKAP